MKSVCNIIYGRFLPNSFNPRTYLVTRLAHSLEEQQRQRDPNQQGTCAAASEPLAELLSVSRKIRVRPEDGVRLWRGADTNPEGPQKLQIALHEKAAVQVADPQRVPAASPRRVGRVPVLVQDEIADALFIKNNVRTAHLL
jgi:hypothetical protein